MLVLAKFDVLTGHKVQWASPDVNLDEVPGIEFKMIPSGLHETSQDIVYFQSGPYEGCAAFSAKKDIADPHDRSQHRIYALAALGEKIPWNQESFLAYELEKFMDFEDVEVLPKSLGPPDPKNHAVLAARRLLEWYGPVTFVLWKAAISRSRVILRSPLPIREMSKFTYLVSRMGIIPSDVVHLLPSHTRASAAEYRCLFNVTLSDMSQLQTMHSFVATTTDDVMLNPTRNVFDAWTARSLVHLADGTTASPTWRDKHRFQQLVEHLGISYVNPQSGWASVLETIFESASSGFVWWASAGDTSLLGEDGLPAASPGEPEGVVMVGAFHNFTRQVVRILAELSEESDNFIAVGSEDLYAMGLDPLASEDRRFIERFALQWWDRPVQYRGKWCCC